MAPRLLIAALLVGLAGFAPSGARASEESDQIDIRVMDIDAHIKEGTAEISPAVCRTQAGTSPDGKNCAAWEFQATFRDGAKKIRKIVETAEGLKVAAPDGAGREAEALPIRRSVSWYYDAQGEPILVAMTYEGSPTSGFYEQILIYLYNGHRELHFNMDMVEPKASQRECPIKGDVAAQGRAKREEMDKKEEAPR